MSIMIAGWLIKLAFLVIWGGGTVALITKFQGRLTEEKAMEIFGVTCGIAATVLLAMLTVVIFSL